MNDNSKFKIQRLIENNLLIKKIEIIDESYKHLHHQKDTQGGHFKILIVSDKFENMTLIKRHKIIYNILDNMIKKEIHALSMKLLTIKEYNNRA